jgi:hypothetical protein
MLVKSVSIPENCNLETLYKLLLSYGIKPQDIPVTGRGGP